jgi:tol-pal system protein YbgF
VEDITIMRLKDLAFAAVLLLMLAGCASKGDMELMQRDMDELKTRLLTVEKEFGGLKSETKEGVEKTLRENQKDLEGIRKGAADLQATLESTRVDLQVLAGKVDDATLAAKKPGDDFALLKEDLDRRLTALDGRVGKLEKNLDDLQKKGMDTAAKPVELSPEALYQQGLDTFKGGNPQKSRELLSKFVDQYPNHELASNAHYWMGETYYTEKMYEQAVLEFEKVIKSYPGKEKVPAALLKQAMAFKELGDKPSARYVLKKLIEQFPKAPEAGLAKTKLKEIK